MTAKTNIHLDEARQLIISFGLPISHQNKFSAPCLLALLNLTPEKEWAQAENPLIGIRSIMEWLQKHYYKELALNSRETVRRITMRQFVEAGIALSNPDDPNRPRNSPKTVYQISPVMLKRLRNIGTPKLQNLDRYNAQVPMEIFKRKLVKDGYPAQSIVFEQFISPGKFADMAIYDKDFSTIRALVEFKWVASSGERMRRLRDATDQLLGYIGKLSPDFHIHAFVVLYAATQLVEEFEVYEIIYSADAVKTQLSGFPAWSDINGDAGGFRGLPSQFQYQGTYSAHVSELEKVFSIARHTLGALKGSNRDAEIIDSDADSIRSIIDEVYSQLSYRFRDLRTPSPWRSPQQLFLSVAMFASQLKLMEARLEEFDSANRTNSHKVAKDLIANLRNKISTILKVPAIAEMKIVSAWQTDETKPPKEVSGRFRKKVDLLIITALRDPEYDAVLELLSSTINITPFPDANSAICIEGTLLTNNSNQQVNVVAATQNDMGLTNAAVLATKLITHFRPKYVAMVGIAAGIDSKSQKIGDILCASHTYDLALGKLEREGKWAVFRPKIYQTAVREHFSHFPSLIEVQVNKDLLNEIEALWNAKYSSSPLNGAPSLHIGPFGSGGTVIADSVEVGVYKNANTALIGFDMEAHAVVTASVECGLAEKPQVAIFKSICDFAGKDKAVKKIIKQRMAAFTSAQFLRLFFLRYVFKA